MRVIIIFLFFIALTFNKVAAQQDELVPSREEQATSDQDREPVIDEESEPQIEEESDAGEIVQNFSDEDAVTANVVPDESSFESVLEIEKSDKDNSLYSMELRNTELLDFFRVLAHDYKLNVLVDDDVSGIITASLTNISLEEALERIVDMNNLRIDKKGNVIIIRRNLAPRVFLLKHVEAKTVLETGSGDEGTTANIYQLLSPEGKILLGTQPNSLMVIDYPENAEKVAVYLDMVDKGVSSKIFKLKYINAKDIVGVVNE
ncbi:MAG: hypothetical protein GY858_01845 [Candidatus Omnitrophica bacterium]|nr:hypothetical protein [Candidatus Omnitrophota bacterium]